MDLILLLTLILLGMLIGAVMVYGKGNWFSKTLKIHPPDIRTKKGKVVRVAALLIAFCIYSLVSLEYASKIMSLSTRNIIGVIDFAVIAVGTVVVVALSRDQSRDMQSQKDNRLAALGVASTIICAHLTSLLHNVWQWVTLQIVIFGVLLTVVFFAKKTASKND